MNGNIGEFGALAKEVSLFLDINPNTLRRWSIELEKCGYVFQRDEKDRRIYYKRDILALTEFKKFLEKTQSLENAAKAVVESVKDRENAEKTLSVIVQNSDKITFTKEELEAYTKRIVEETAQKTAEQILHKFNQTLEQRDRQLVQSLQQTMEQRRLELAAATEEKQSFWSRLFGKKTKALDKL
uniref:Putative DNA binding protein n=1 Tax=Geobacillus sp. (strain WCH70) TaxID=471223 RepID=C5DB37_GEOSW